MGDERVGGRRAKEEAAMIVDDSTVSTKSTLLRFPSAPRAVAITFDFPFCFSKDKYIVTLAR